MSHGFLKKLNGKCRRFLCFKEKIDGLSFCRKCICSTSCCPNPKTKDQLDLTDGKCDEHCSSCTYFLRDKYRECCKNIPINKNYCSKHECVYPGCDYVITDNKKYCVFHICSNEEINCTNAKAKNNMYCENCICKYKDCDERISVNFKACWLHTCKYKECKNMRINSSDGCNKHICKNHKSMLRVKNTELCEECIQNLKYLVILN